MLRTIPKAFMEHDSAKRAQSAGGDQWFATTHWSVVLAARDEDSAGAGEALERLCRTYWYPLYGYARRCGSDAPDAQDLTQGFFARLLEKDSLAQVGREKGKFRSFLLTAFKHFISDEHDRNLAAKRGGGRAALSLDDESAEDRYACEPATALSPDKLFERQWAVALLDRAMARLRAEYAAKHKEPVFAQLKPFLADTVGEGDYAEAAARLGVSLANVPVMVHRLRQRYRELVRAEVANTVAHPSEVEEELRQLLAALSH